MHANGSVCYEFLKNLLDEFREERMKTSIDGKFSIYSKEIEDAKKILSKEMLSKEIIDDIFSMSREDFSEKWYHELKHNQRKALAILVWSRIFEQKSMTDLEYHKVFSHIVDLNARNQKALDARTLLEHIGELAKLMVNDEQKKNKAPLDKGKIAYLFYLWTETEMSENAFVNEYYNEMCRDEKYHVSRSSLNMAKNSDKITAEIKTLFALNAAQIIKEYKPEAPLYMVNSKQDVPFQKKEIPLGLIAKQKTLAENSLAN